MTDIDAIRHTAFRAHAAGDIATAERLYRRMLAVAPADAVVLHHLGLILGGCGRLDLALPLLRHSLWLLPNDATFHYNVGLILRTAVREEEALASFRHAAVLQPGLAAAHHQIGQILQERGEYAAANRHFSPLRRQSGVENVGAEIVGFNRVFHTGEDAHDAPRHWPAPPLVSIVIPCYNYGEFVREAVDSCLAQTYPNLEVVLVEGGSTDGRTPAVVRTIRHPRVRTVYRWPRRKVGDNRNFGLGLARGEYVCCLDADDRLDPQYIEKALFLMVRFGYDLVGACVRIFGDDDGLRRFLRRPELADFLITNQMPTPGVHRRASWEASGGFYDFDGPDGYVYEDWNYWVRLVAMGARAFNITWEPLILYRDHGRERITRKQTILPLDRQQAAIRVHNADVLPE